MEDRGEGVPIALAVLAVLLTARLTGFANVPWWVILSPVWVPIALVLAGGLIVSLGRWMQGGR